MKTDAEVEALIASLEAASHDERLATGLLYRDAAGVIREQRAEIARLTAENDAGIARLAARLGAGTKFTANYTFDKTDTHTRLFCAASDWMDRATAAEQRIAELEEALADIMEMLDAGFLVRNTAADNDPAWAIKDIPYLVKLGKAAALAPRKAEP